MRDWINKIHCIDWIRGLKSLPDGCIDMLITSPPYWGLRDYGVEGQLGLEKTPGEYIDKLIVGFTEALRILKPTGTCWVNLGDTYSAQRWSDSPSTTGISSKCSDVVIEKKTGLPDKCLTLIPERFALAMVETGWILRNRICWHKPNPMPSSVKDRFTNTWEYLFFFVKEKRYFFDLDVVREPHSSFEKRPDYIKKIGFKAGKKFGAGCKGEREKGQNISFNPLGKNPGDMFKGPPPGQIADQFKRKGHSGYYDKKGNLMVNPAGKNPGDFFEITTQPFPEAHFATFPEKLLEKPIKAGCPEGGIILDPFMGSGTTAVVARKYSRNYIGFELNPEYIKIAEKRLSQGVLF